MPDGLYERDALLWSEQQADLLQRLAAGERLNAPVDWPNVIEEVLDLGRSELHACESLLEQAMVHLMKLHGAPDHAASNHWRAELLAFLSGARRRFAPSMAQRIDLQILYEEALRQAGAVLAVTNPIWPDRCPYATAELIDRNADLPGLIARLTGEG